MADKLGLASTSIHRRSRPKDSLPIHRSTQCFPMSRLPDPTCNAVTPTCSIRFPVKERAEDARLPTWRIRRRMTKGQPMLSRIVSILMAATLAGGYLAAAVLLATAAPAIAQRSTTLDAWRLGGPSGASIGLANPGTRDLARPTDPNQVFSLPGFPAPSQTQPLGASGTATSNGIGQRLGDD
jgi:hypothetical protein